MQFKTVLVTYLIAHSLKILLLTDERWTFPDGIRFVFIKTIPILLYVGLFYGKEIKHILKMDSLRELTRVTTSFILIVVFLGSTFFLAVQPKLTYISWTWFAIATWGYAFLIFYFLLGRKFRKYEAFILSLLFCKLGGFLYEIPIYPSMSSGVGIYFHVTHPFGLDFNYFLIPLLIYYLRKKYKISVSKPMIASFTLYLVFSIFYFFNKAIPLTPFHIHRVPAILFLICIVLQLKRKTPRDYEIENYLRELEFPTLSL